MLDQLLAAPVQTDAPLPSLDSALQQQLGLKLTGRRESIDTIVVVNAAKPAAN